MLEKKNQHMGRSVFRGKKASINEKMWWHFV